ncbi:MAG: hypothetical protein KDC87_20800, partial [Planctomycetes bacterium]|nr:hypothetical protein [Planctomycetota bacterium]
VQTAGGRFMQATGGGGGGLRIGGATSVGDPSRTPWEVFALKDLNGGRLQHGDLVAIKTASGHWWRQQGQYVNADAIRLGLGTFFFVYKASGSGAIEQNDRFHLVAMNGYYVRALGNVTTANATSPLSYGTFTMQRTSVDSMRLGQELVTQTRLSWGASFRALDTDRNGVLEAHECVLAMYFADLIGDGGAHRGFSTSTVPGESGLRISTSLLYLYDRTNISTITHELTHTLGTDDVYGSGGRYNYRVSLMGATIDGNPTLRVHLDCWHRMRLGWVVPRIIPMVGYNGAEVLRAVSSNVASWENRPIILYDPGRYSLGSRSGEFFMLEARTRVSGYYDESLATEGLAVWQIKTNSAGQLLAITEGKSLLVQSADGRRDGSTLFQEQDGVITPRYYDGQAAAVRLRVSRPYATQPERMVVEISRDGAMVPVITGVSGSLTVGSTLNVFGELSPQSGAYPLVLMNVAGGGGSFSLSPTRHGTYWSVTIPSWAPIGAYDLQARQWGRYSTSRRITLR